MISLNEVFQALIQQYPLERIELDPSQNRLTLPAFQAEAFQTEDRIAFRFSDSGQQFTFHVEPYDTVYALFSGLITGTIRVSRFDDCTLRVDGIPPELRYRNRQQTSARHRIISAVAGGLFLLLGGFFMLMTISMIDHSTVDWPSTLIPAVLALTPFTMGGGLIHHALSKEPISTFRLLGVGLAILILGFGTTLMYTSFTMMEEQDTIADIIGVSIVALLINVIGALILWGSLHNSKPAIPSKPMPSFLRRDIERPSEELTSAILDQMIKDTQTTQIRMICEPDRVPSRTESKIGGVPYWDTSRPFPLDENGKPMSLLAQIVLADLPENDMLPREGMLQFFLGDIIPGDTDDTRRVIWHKTIDPNQPEISYTQDDEVLPFEGECAVRFECETVSVPPVHREIELYMRQAAKELGIPLNPSLQFWELAASDVNEARCRALREWSAGSHLLGYPVFAQEDDTRAPEDDRDVLLFQMDSQSRPFPICWGDFGTAHFFISAEKLKQMDFSDVSFSWDCY